MTTLIDLINRQDRILDSVFTDQFATADRWEKYLSGHFNSQSNPVTELLKSDPFTAGDFQALYVACWVTEPCEKGSYMIEMSREQRLKVKTGYKQLSRRWSSHLKKKGKKTAYGRSAGQNWRFLKGYNELLVQLLGGGKNDPPSSCHEAQRSAPN